MEELIDKYLKNYIPNKKQNINEQRIDVYVNLKN